MYVILKQLITIMASLVKSDSLIRYVVVMDISFSGICSVKRGFDHAYCFF